MNTTNKTIVVSTVVFSMITAVSAPNFHSRAFAQSGFNAKISAQEEVPHVQTQATGNAVFTPMGYTVHFIMNATNLRGATAGQIHSGSPGENGPILVTLFKFDSPQNEVNMESMLAAGKLEGPMQGKQISKLVTAMGNGSTYVNVQTSQNPNDEISVQISCGQ